MTEDWRSLPPDQLWAYVAGYLAASEHEDESPIVAYRRGWDDCLAAEREHQAVIWQRVKEISIPAALRGLTNPHDYERVKRARAYLKGVAA